MGCFKVCYTRPTCWLASTTLGNICDDAMSCSGQGVDTVLSETGIQQCEVVGRYFRDTKFSNVFVSDLQRTIEVRE